MTIWWRSLIFSCVTVGVLLAFGVSRKRNENYIICWQPNRFVSAPELAHPLGYKFIGSHMQDLPLLKVFRHEAVVGNLGNKNGKTLQDGHREDTCDEAVCDIERDFSESELASLITVSQEGLRRTRNQDDSQEAWKRISLSKREHINVDNWPQR